MRHEDVFAVEPELGLFVVCDGGGGRASGVVAAALAASTIREWVWRESSSVTAARSSQDVASVRERERDAIQGTSQAIRELVRTGSRA